MRLFGTDGIRGVFGKAPLDQATVERFGFELGQALIDEGAPAPCVIAGGDTRDSTPQLASWVARGLAAAGGRLRWAATLPTPGVARLVLELEADAGLAISASHNLHPDNGLKLFDHRGLKWDLGRENALEERVLRREESAATKIGETPPRKPIPEPELHRHYLEDLERSVGERPLSGLRLAIDAANGAAAPFVHELFRDLGAEASIIGDTPDGQNINRGCGSTAPERLIELTHREKCDLGIAFDGDADRVVLCDESGALQDGDTILYLWASELMRAGKLDPPAVVATSMSNLGLAHALRLEGIELIWCGVGDRTVVHTLLERGLKLGGEQSGHIINLDDGTTGDGLLTAVHIAALLARGGKPLSARAAGLSRFPQVLTNIAVREKPDLETLPDVIEAISEVEKALGENGRQVVRYSGTEPLARVMVEGPDQDLVERYADQIARAIERSIGREEP